MVEKAKKFKNFIFNDTKTGRFVTVFFFQFVATVQIFVKLC